MALTVKMIVQALRDLGGERTAVEIRDHLFRLFPDIPMGRHPLSAVRARLQDYSRDSGQYKKRADLFRRVTPPEVRLGIWALRAVEELKGLDDESEQPESDEPLLDDAEVGMALEGRQTLRMHLKRERNQRLVERFKDSLDSFACRVCAFDFEQAYGEIGAAFIEAHHTKPISDGERQPLLSDLIAVCSNCHRMLHRNGLMDWEVLRTLVERGRDGAHEHRRGGDVDVPNI